MLLLLVKQSKRLHRGYDSVLKNVSILGFKNVKVSFKKFQARNLIGITAMSCYQNINAKGKCFIQLNTSFLSLFHPLYIAICNHIFSNLN
jgi:hypothetical protein